eukprot:jgi/Tetstr1/433188/TSEL_002371.t1
MAYWADFLDLQASGPLPWLKEIEEGIAHCSKFVAFVDNELALDACHYSKPFVVLVLERQAWELLTGAGGAGPAHMYVRVMHELFSGLSSINLCDCGIRDGALGSEEDWHAMLRVAQSFVEQDDLDREAVFWGKWVQDAECHSLNPRPTGGMEEFLSASRRNSSRRRRLMRALGALLVLVLVAGMDGSTLMAQQARTSQYEALSAEQTAEQRAWEAKTAKGLAEQRAWEGETAGAMAEQRAQEAQRARDEAKQSRKLAEHLAFEAAVTASDSDKATAACLCRTKFAPMPHAGDMAFKVLREMLARLPGEVATFLNTTVLDAGRSLLQKPWHYTAEVLQGYAGFVTSVAMSPDSRSLASGSWDRTVRVWQLGEDGAADGGAPLDAIVRLWRLGDEDTVQSNASQVLQGHAGGVLSVAWAHGGRSLASGSQDCVAGVGEDDAVDGSTSQVLRGNIGTVNAVASAPDGRSLASGSREATVRVWRVGIGGAVEGSAPQVLKGHTTVVHSVGWARDGRSLASGSGDYTALESSASQELRGHTDWVAVVAWAPDGRALASGSRDATVRVWWVGTNGAVEDATFQVLRGHTEGVTSVAWAPNGRFLASGYLDASVRVWRVGKDGAVETGNTPQALQGRTRSAKPFGFDFQSLTSELLDFVTALAWAPDSRSLAAGSDDNTVRVWRVARTAQRMAAPRNCCTATLTG